jgi:hypothetical protein
MIKSINEKTSGIEIDLTGPDGNAFVLIGMASKFAKQLGLDYKVIQTEMMSGDYENLLNVFEKNFGEYVTLYR